MTALNRTLTKSALTRYLGRGWSVPRIAQHLGIPTSTAQSAATRYGLTLMDAPGVLVTEVAARNGVTRGAVNALARTWGIKPTVWRSALMLTRREAAEMDAYYAQQQAAPDYAHYLTGKAAAARLGITQHSLNTAMSLGRLRYAALVRVQVRTRTRWAYRYCPRSVERVIRGQHATVPSLPVGALGLSDAAALIGTDETTIRKWARQGCPLHEIQRGGRFVWPAEVLAWVEARPEAPPAHRAKRAAMLSRLRAHVQGNP